MTRGDIMRVAIRTKLRSIIWWAASTAALVGFTIAVYPSVEGQESLGDLVADYPEFFQQLLGLAEGFDITSPVGYLNSQVFTNVLPLVFLVFLIGFAARTIAGEERAGTLDLMLAHPVTRRRVVLEKAGAMAAMGLSLATVSTLTMTAGAAVISMDIAVGDLLAANITTMVMGMLFASLAMAVGCATGSRAIALGTASGYAVATFLLWGLAPVVSWLQPLEKISPFFWALAGPPIAAGFQWLNIAGLLTVTAVLAAASVMLFERRDVKV